MKKLPENLECPFCEGLSVVETKDDTIVFKDKEYDIDYYFYKCIKCGEQFTTTESDIKTFSQIPNYFR